MKVLVDINHPAHVHFFKNIISQLNAKGHKTLVTSIDKEITLQLLRDYGIPFEKTASYKNKLWKKILQIPIKDLKTLKHAWSFKPDLYMGLASYSASHVAFALAKKSLIFDDTEHATAEVALYKPFCTKVLTPSCYEGDLGPKQVRYPGYHELAYLHPNHFKPDSNVVKELNLKPGEKLAIVRYVSWEAGHDRGEKGLTLESKRLFINSISPLARIVITSEKQLPEEFEPFRMKISPSKIHHLMAYADLVYGESATMASEAAVLGTPAIFCDPYGRGYNNEQEKVYALVSNFKLDPQSQKASVEKAVQILSNPEGKKIAKEKQAKLLKDKVDVADFVVKYIENLR